MANQVRVFVSHHHSPDEDAFTARLVADLEVAGADVWVDTGQIASGNFVQKISEGLAGRQWLVLVMTPQSVASPWVRNEVNAALSEHTAGRMLGVVPLVMTLTAEQDIPLLWRPLHRYDATRAYAPARDALLGALGLSAQQVPTATHQPALAVSPATPYPVLARLGTLGYQGVSFAGTPVYLPPLIPIPAGPFLMGSDTAQDSVARDNEIPQYWVEVEAFQIAKYPVTVAEYALAVSAEGVREPPQKGDVTWVWQRRHPDHPVVCVSWDDAMAYVAWLRTVTGQGGWRLPTEAEWEKAARWDPQRQVNRIYPWGDTNDQNRCNTEESGIKTTTPVGSYPASDARRSGASAYGVEEMAGNVWEWTSSLFKPYPYTTSDGREDSKATEERTRRGGCWFGNTWFARAAGRYGDGPDYISYVIGFRLVLGSGAGS